ncbi:MAG: hypothetical protein WD823_07790 [Sulfuricaulis sp.]|uniref:tetratricopeptide repeat protein n=1 Tax=Sulfuricaulis sp. TaxID=2003553 RepID=UPI0034A1B7D4
MIRNHVGIKLLCSLALILSAAVYLPGISGPFIFDDYTNLLFNSYIKIQSLDSDTLHQAAYSLGSGPLQRPISMLSFALNYYFAGDFKNTAPYKLTNLGIHIINGLLLFWMMQLVFSRLRQLKKVNILLSNSVAQMVTLLAFSVALLWLIHPIQITSVLYVIQRMTELSAMFTLAGLIFYLKGRVQFLSGQKNRAWLSVFGLLLCGLLGMFSKENTILLPVFILALDFVLFPRERPWSEWSLLPVLSKRIVITAFLATAAIGLVLAIQLALPDYAARRFNMPERLMTEGRVLIFYLSLILLPQINRFGHQHDDIPISTSLFEPWTTLPALIGIVGLLVIAFKSRKKFPLISLGIFWFFAGHLLESTIVALELAHEHRNYLPSAGIIMALFGLIDLSNSKLGHRKLWWVVPVMALIFVGSTSLRASQWANYNSFYRYEVMHHPDSSRVQAGFAILLEAQGQYNAALEAIRRAYRIEPTETGYLIQTHLLTARSGKQIDPVEHAKTLKLLAAEPLSATTYLSIQHIANCVQTWCKSLQISMEEWLRVILNRDKLPGDKSFYHYALGISLASQNRIDEAIESLWISHQMDPFYLHPLFAMASIYIQLQQPDNAEQVLLMLRSANEDNPHPRTKELELLAEDIEKLKRGKASITSRNQEMQ